MKVRIGDHRCVGHAMCVLACPEIFVLSDEDGHAAVRGELVPAHCEEAVWQAERGCPEGAIIVE